MLMNELTNGSAPLSRHLRKMLAQKPGVSRDAVRILGDQLEKGREAANRMRSEPVERNEDGAMAVALEICTYARAAHTLAEIQCTGIPRHDEKLRRSIDKWDGEDDDALEHMRDAIKARVRDIGQAYGVENVTIKGDPRGHVLLLHFMDGASNRGQGSTEWGVE